MYVDDKRYSFLLCGCDPIWDHVADCGITNLWQGEKFLNRQWLKRIIWSGNAVLYFITQSHCSPESENRLCVLELGILTYYVTQWPLTENWILWITKLLLCNQKFMLLKKQQSLIIENRLSIFSCPYSLACKYQLVYLWIVLC